MNSGRLSGFVIFGQGMPTFDKSNEKPFDKSHLSGFVIFGQGTPTFDKSSEKPFDMDNQKSMKTCGKKW